MSYCKTIKTTFDKIYHALSKNEIGKVSKIYVYIYPQTRVSSFLGLISVARVNEYRTIYIYIYIYIYIKELGHDLMNVKYKKND